MCHSSNEKSGGIDRGRLSVADSWIGATAITREAVLIHKNPEFTKFAEIAQEAIGG
jgi:predicted nucleic acid-binding protein